MDEEEKAWLAGLKVGDEVAINFGRRGETDFLFKAVERASQTQVVVGGCAFCRSNGYERGPNLYGLRRLWEPERARKLQERYEAAKAITQKTKEAKSRITETLDKLLLKQLVEVEEFVKGKADIEEQKWGVK